MIKRLPRAPEECHMITVNFNSEVAKKTHKTMQVNKARLRRALEWLDKNNKAFHRNGIILDYKKLERYNGDPNLLSLLPKSKSIPLDQVPKDAVPSDTIPPELANPEESKE